MQNKWILLLILVIPACHSAQYDNPYTSWSTYGGSPDQSKFVTLDDIDKSNVDQLEIAWIYSTDDEVSYHFNPVIVDTVMYVLAKDYSLVALDARTGEEIWIHAHLNGIADRGINYWESEDGTDKRLLFQLNDNLQAINAETGESIREFGDEGLVDLRQNLPPRDPATIRRVQSRTPGIIFENLILLGSAPGEGYMSAPGHLRAYDVVTGDLEWIFHTIPQPGEYGYETWPEDAYQYVGGVNVWAESSLDMERGIAYFTLGSPTYDYYGGDRIGKNLFGNSILALDARTGERIWYYQLVYHDLWDYDLSAAPQLVTVNHDGEEIDAVAVATKQGFLFAFNRVTGESLWPIEDRPVPASHVPGEEAWPTQPFPTQLEPFARHSMNPDSLNPYFLTDEEREAWRERLTHLEEVGQTGLFTPLSDRYETLSLPGAQGGANFGGTAADPDRGIVYVKYKDHPSIYPRLEKRDYEEDAVVQSQSETNPVTHGRNIYMASCQVCHGADRDGIASAPSLHDIETRMSASSFQQLMYTGLGEMPSFSYMDEEDVSSIYQFLGGTSDGDVVEIPKGPVVARGGIPGGQIFRFADTGGGRLGAPYPEGVDSFDRYYIDGWGLGYAYIMPPPWSSIAAYDLNEGVIKWRRPIGNDKLAAEMGAEEDTGILGSGRKGMIVTSTGLLFSTAGDGKVHAFDADTGEKLWEGQLPRATEGLPSMYVIDGKSYLAVVSTNTLRWGRGVPEYENSEDEPQGGYVVFSLPNQE